MDRIAYRPEEVAKLTGLGRTTVFEEIRTGSLESVKVGRARLITAGALDRWLGLRAEADGAPDAA